MRVRENRCHWGLIYSLIIWYNWSTCFLERLCLKPVWSLASNITSEVDQFRSQVLETSEWIKKSPFEFFIGRRWIFLSLYLIWVIQRSEHLLKIYSRAYFRWRFICSIIQISFRGHLVSFFVMYGPLTVPRFEFEIINSWNIGAYLIQPSFESSESCSGPGGW